MQTQLFAPEAFWDLTDEQRAKLCNGCGPGKMLGFLVPDTLWGLSIAPACDIHDFMYITGETIADKDSADRVFLNNMLRLIDANTRWDWLKYFRARKARTYYLAVRELGGPWFWAGKNSPHELGYA